MTITVIRPHVHISSVSSWGMVFLHHLRQTTLNGHVRTIKIQRENGLKKC